MIGIEAENIEQMDYKTSRSICDAVGERLQKDLRPERSDLSPHLRELLNELRRRDETEALRPRKTHHGKGAVRIFVAQSHCV